MHANRQPAEASHGPSRARRIALRLAMACCAGWLLLPPTRGLAQSFWEMTPYRIELIVAVDPAAAPCSHLVETLPKELLERIDNLVGAVWQLNLRTPSTDLAATIQSRLERLTADDLGKLPDGIDKVLLLAVSADRSGFRLRAHDYDLRTRTWNAVVENHVPHRELLADAAFDVLWKAFSPIAQVDVDADRNVILRPRAGGLPLRDPTLHLASPGDLFRPVVRKLDRQGRTAEAGLQVIPWTFLTVDEVDGIQARCKSYSGLRQSLGTRRRGQSEQLAIAVRPDGGDTLLRIVGRGEPPQPLPGYDVYAQVPGQKATVHVGRTNSLGEIVIPSVAENPVRILYVKGGGILLARLPMVPGVDARLTAEVADDDRRLALEGYLASVRDSVVDLVARREILMARIRNRIGSKKFDEAEKLFDELRRLPTRESISVGIVEEKTRNAGSDPAVQAKIDRAVGETQKSVNRFLDPRPIDALRTELNQAVRSSEAGSDNG